MAKVNVTLSIDLEIYTLTKLNIQDRQFSNLVERLLRGWLEVEGKIENKIKNMDKEELSKEKDNMLSKLNKLNEKLDNIKKKEQEEEKDDGKPHYDKNWRFRDDPVIIDNTGGD